MPQPEKGAEQPDELAQLSFEASLDRLESVVDQLERGDLELEASLEAFEEGVRLSARCSEQLASAEQRIETLTREGGKWFSRPFESSGTGGPTERVSESVDAAEND